MPNFVEACDCEVLLLGVLPTAQTAVGRGENAGRLPREFKVVRQIDTLTRGNGRAQRRMESIPELPADAALLVLLAPRRSGARIVAVGIARTQQGGTQGVQAADKSTVHVGS